MIVESTYYSINTLQKKPQGENKSYLSWFNFLEKKRDFGGRELI